MKKLLLLIGLVVLLSPLVHAGQYDGKWENKTSKYSCNTGGVFPAAFSYLFSDDIVILNNKVKMGNLKTIGKVKKNLLGVDMIGMNTIYGHLGGKIKYNTMTLKFTPTFDTWKPLSKCAYKFVKVDQTQKSVTAIWDAFESFENIDRTAKGFCLRFNGTVYETVYEHACLMDREITKEEYLNKKIPDTTQVVKSTNFTLRELKYFAARYCGNYPAVSTNLGIKCSNKLHGAKKVTKIVKSTNIQLKELEEFAARYCGNYPAVNTNLGIKCSNKLHGAKKETLALNKNKSRIELQAEKGDVYSQYLMGKNYEFGEGGFPVNLNKAVYWHKLAAAQGNAYAQGKIGYFYATGKGDLKADMKIAVRWFKLAAAQGEEYAQYNLAYCYENGYGGLQVDEKEALRLYKKAALKNHPSASKKVKELEIYIAKNEITPKIKSDIRIKELEDFAEKYCGKYPAVNTDLGIKCSNRLHGAKKTTQTASTKKETKIVKATTPAKKTTQQNIVTEQTIIVKNDTTGPKIIINKIFKANKNMIVNIKGRVEDDSKIVSLTIDGDQVTFTQGRFNQTLYVLPNGQEIEIVAIDKFGNQSKTSVTLERATLQIQTVVFDKLNPLLIKVPLNNNAAALIIGIEEYENTISAPFAKKDAQIFNDFAHQSFGVPRQYIKLLTNSIAKRNDTLNIIATWLPKVIKENKTDLYVFFSGHGLASEDGKDLFLLPYDGYPAILKDSALLRNKIFDSIAKLNPKSVTVFLDTCYSGATRSDEFLVAAKPIFIEVAEQEIPDNFTVFSASAGKETAKILKEAEHGLFSYFLMKGLEGEADKNNDQQITNGELIAFIKNNVSRQANQTPQLAGDADRILVQW